MKKQMELIQRVLLEKRSQGSGVYRAGASAKAGQSRDTETIGLDIIGAIGMTGWLVLVVGHCV